MSTLFRLIKWFWRAWPVIVLISLFCFHLFLIYYFQLNANTTNKTISLFSQLIGGLLILYSIDSNIGVIRGKSLFSMFTNFLKDFPLIKKSVVLQVQNLSMSTSLSNADITIDRNPTSINEKLEYLQEQIDQLKRNLEQKSNELHKKIDDHSKEMNTNIQETKSALQDIASKVDEVSVGGIKVQLFGVLLLIYGSISDYFA